MDHYAVFGNPIQHSLSPVIHQLFAAQTGQNLIYTKVFVPLDSFAIHVDHFQKQGGKGLNVTLPFKQEAYHLLESVSERAKQARAINTIRFHDNGSRYGDNTDGVGFIRDLKHNLQLTLANKRILILGAGGAVRGILGPLLAEHPHHITIANRTIEKATLIANEFNQANLIHTCSLNNINENHFDIIINGLSSSLSGEFPKLNSDLLTQNTFCYDLVYGRITPFLNWAKSHGVSQVADGLGMLVEQAAEAFYLWRGVRPETQEVILKLRNK
jgi:shikimate dehydrogenase